MRALLVHPHDIYDPLEPWTLRVTALGRALVELGHEIKLVYHLSSEDRLPGDLRHRQEHPFEVIPWIRHMGRGLHKSRQMIELARWADLVHVQKALPHAALPATAAALWRHLPLHYDWDDWEAAIYEDSTGQRDKPWRRINRFERTLPRLADTVTVASRALREQALALGVSPERLFDAPVGADLDHFSAGGDGEAVRQRLGLAGPIALYLGQLAGSHAAPLFLDAAASVARRQPDACFVVVGGGRTLPDLKAHAARLGLEERLVFTGPVPHGEVPDYLDAADVAVATLPDTAQAATKSPLKVVEYMAAGKAIVASRVGEAVTFLDEGRVGVLVEPGSAEALADGVASLLADPLRRAQLGALARQHLRGHHTWMHSARQVDAAWRRARELRGLDPEGRSPARGLGPTGRGAQEEPRVPQASVAPHTAPPAVTDASLPQLLGGPRGALRRSLQGRLDLVGVLQGEWAYTGPYTIQLDVTNRCNNDCIACWLHSPLLAKTGPNARDRRAQLRFDVVRQLLDDAWALGTRDLYMAGGGDPIVYPWLRETVEHAKGLGMTVAINTNLTLADEDWCRWACEVGLDDLTASIWAGTAAGYDATHPNKKPRHFDRLVEVLTFLNHHKREVGRGPTVKLYQVVSALNADEFQQMVELVDRTGSDAVEFTVVDTVPGHTDGLLFDEPTRQRLLRQSLDLQDRLERAGQGHKLFGFDQWLRRLRCDDLHDARGDANVVHTLPCTIGWTFLRVMPDGRVTSCLKSHRIPIGDINEQRLPQLWNNARQREFRLKTNVLEKRDPWFSNIGNDPNAVCGCEKSCDDLGRNFATWRRLQQLRGPERVLVSRAPSLLQPAGVGPETTP